MQWERVCYNMDDGAEPDCLWMRKPWVCSLFFWLICMAVICFFFVIIDFYASHGWIMSTTSSDVSSHLSENMSDYWSFPDIVHSSTST